MARAALPESGNRVQPVRRTAPCSGKGIGQLPDSGDPGGPADGSGGGDRLSSVFRSAIHPETRALEQERDALRFTLERREHLCRLLEHLAEATSDGIVALDFRGRPVHISDGLGPADPSEGDCPRGEVLPRPILRRLRKEAKALDPDHSHNFDLEWERPETGVRWYRVTAVAAELESEGTGLGKLVLFSFRDRTREALVEAELERARQLAALGQMAGTVAHELRNPLAAIQGFATLLRRDLAGQPGPARQVERILQGVEGADRIVNDLLEYCRPVRFQADPVSLEELLQESLAVLRASVTVPGRIGIDLKVDAGLASCLGDRRLLLQALLNLYRNAVEAMGPEGSLSIRVRAAGSGLRPDRLRIVVRDTGCGLTAEEVAQVFAPFYSRKPGGTGLGLAVVRKIVEAHRGHVHVVSAPGRGTSVVIDLPAAGVEVGPSATLEVGAA